jgi:lysine biosynthesis protein LysW
MAQGYCPDCDSDIKLGNDPRKGQKVTCPSCGAYLEVVGLSPIELDWALDDDEEYEMDYEGDEEGYEY